MLIREFDKDAFRVGELLTRYYKDFQDRKVYSLGAMDNNDLIYTSYVVYDFPYTLRNLKLSELPDSQMKGALENVALTIHEEKITRIKATLDTTYAKCFAVLGDTKEFQSIANSSDGLYICQVESALKGLLARMIKGKTAKAIIYKAKLDAYHNKQDKENTNIGCY